MEIFRKQMDKKILEQLKDKIIIYLKNSGFQKCEFIRENLDKVAGLYVENMIERDGPRMQSRGEKAQWITQENGIKVVKKPGEIVIDKGFVLFDENDNPIGIDANVKKLIMTQLTHELIHSGSRFDGHSGIKTTKQNTGLDEGMTQMFTEKIWGYTLSPNSDSRYKDFKKIAKILDATFGEQVSIDAYFNHSDALENACNSLSQNDRFYSDMNKYLTSIYDMRKAVPKDIRDRYYQTVMQPISNRMIDLVYNKVCAEIVIPKLRSLSRDEQGAYLQNILNSIKDEPDVLRKLSETIVRYSNMTEPELHEQIEDISKGLQQVEQEKQFVINVYKSPDCSKLVDIFDDGKTIRTTGKNAFSIEDEFLKEKVLSQIYFQEKGFSKEAFGRNVKNMCDNLEQDSDLSFGDEERTALDRKKSLSAIKVMARENGYMLLNSLEECESGKNILLEAVKAQKGEKISFQDLKNIYQKFDIFYKDDDYSQLYVKDRVTNKEMTDPQIQIMGRFAAVWAGAAGTKWMSDEEIKGITYAFNEPSERVFSKLGELVVKSLTEKGTIDTENIYKAISNDGYKHSEEIVRSLLANPASIKIVYDFYKMQNDDAKLETRLAKSTNEILYGYSAEDSLVAEKLDDIMKSIPNVETKDIQDQQGSEINEFCQIIRPTEIQVQKQGQPDMVTLPNGVQIPRKQYEEEQGTKKSSKGLSIGDVKSSISKGKVTTQETQSATQDMKKLMEIKRLQVMQKTGQALTPEQKLLIDEHIRQTQQAQMQFQQGQESKKSKRNGLEI